jgi:cystathionine beta-synthase
MREKGYLEKKGMVVRDIVSAKQLVPLVTLESSEPVGHAVRVMSEHDFSQIPVTRKCRIVGSLSETHLFAELVRNPDVREEPVERIMQPAFPFVDISTTVDMLATMITPQNPAVLVRDFKTDETYIITRHDVIRALS